MSSTVQTRLTGEPATTNTDDVQADVGRCTCPWPDDVKRVHVTVGRNSAGQARRRVEERCTDCGGRVN